MRLDRAVLSVLFFALLSMFSQRAQAQLGEYAFSQSFTPYVALTTTNIPLDTVGATTGYVRRAYHVALPFSFTLGNITSDSVWIDLAGFCALKRTSAPPAGFLGSHLALSQMPYYEGIIAAKSGVFNTTVSLANTAGIRTDVSGIAPNRIFTIEWRNIHGTTNRHVQARLYETSGVIDFAYAQATSTTDNAEIGLRLADTTVFTGKTVARTSYYVDPVTNLLRHRRWDTTSPALHLGQKMVLTYFVPAGLRYTWTPPPPCATATAVGPLPDSLQICAGKSVLLVPGGLTSGLNYQWQTSPDGTTWNNVTTGMGAQNFQYATARIRDTLPVWYRLQATCASTQQVLTSNPVKIKTSYTTAPYFEGFEGLSTNTAAPPCMSIPPPPLTGSTQAWYGIHSAANSYDGVRAIRNSSSTSEWVYTPGIYLQPGKQYRFSHMYLVTPYMNPGTDTIRVGVGTAPQPDSILNVASATQDSVPYYGPPYPTLASREKYRRMEVVFTVPAAGVYFGGIRRACSNSTGAYVDNIEIMEVPAVDAQVDSVLSPSVYTTDCFLPQMPVTVRVKNAGAQPLSNIPVYWKLNTTTYGPEIVAGPIAPGAAIQHTFSQMAAMPVLEGVYKIQAWSALAGDTYLRNDTSYVMAIRTDTLKPVPYVQPFEATGSFLASDVAIFKWWGTNPWSTVATTTNTSRILRMNLGLLPVGGKDSIATVPIGPIATNSFMRFQYRMANTAGNAATMQAGDTVYVLGTMNCGQEMDTLLKLHAGAQNPSATLQRTSMIPLGQFAGGRLRVSFVSRKGSSATNFFVDIDSFQVLNAPLVELQLASVTEMASVACAGDPVPVRVAVRNNGGLTASQFPVKALVNGQPSPLAYTYSGALGYQQSDTVTIGTLTFPSPGTYEVKLFVQQPGETNLANDTLMRTVWTVTPPATPAPFDTVGCNGPFTLELPAAPDSTVTFWYADNAPGTAFFQTGTTLTNVNTTDSFYIARRKTVATGAGPVARHPSWSSEAQFAGAGLLFNAHSAFMLDSVGIYPSGTGSVTVQVVSCASCAQPLTIGTYTFSFTAASASVKRMVPLGLHIPAGRDYAIKLQSYSGLNGVVRDFPFTGFPLSAPSWPLTITSSVLPSGPGYDFYYYFYDWKVRALSSCITPRAGIAVEMSIPPAPAFNANVGSSTVAFNNASNGGGTFAWSFGDGANSSAVSPSHTYAAPGTYAVTLVQTNSCGTDSVTSNVVIQSTGIGAVLPEGWSNLSAYPNPASGVIHLAFVAQRAEEVAVSVVDASGRRLRTNDHRVVAGSNVLQQDLSGLAPGTYWMMIRTAEGTARVGVTVMR